jgi:omega-amidase
LVIKHEKNMKIALIQTDLIWEKAKANRENFARKISTIPSDVDLIVLPEMFTTGFSMKPQNISETMDGETVLWMKKTARTKNCAITGSVIIYENGKYYNRLLFVFPSGEIQKYDKRHLFSLADENEAYTAGTERLIIEHKGFKICPLICYDLRFPAFSRNNEDFDVLIYVANWPKPRTNAWDVLLKARAVENMCYVIGANRIGTDNNGHEYIGHSQVIDYLGNNLINPQEVSDVFVSVLDKNKMLKTRKQLGFLNDRDHFKITPPNQNPD